MAQKPLRREQKILTTQKAASGDKQSKEALRANNYHLFPLIDMLFKKPAKVFQMIPAMLKDT